MIERYTNEKFAQLWSLQNKFDTWLDIEIYATQAWEKLGVVPQGTADAMRKNAHFTIARIDEIEQSTHHDVVAFTRCVAESLNEESKWLHFGLTSTDVVDTALCAITVQAVDVLLDDVNALILSLSARALEFKDTPCMGRTHGVHAEPTTFGLKFVLWRADMQRNLERLQSARNIIAVGKLSGAVGNYGNIDPFVEKYVCEMMHLQSSPISTQVLQRDRHAELLCTIAIIGGCIEKMATEIRHWQRTELREAEEPFAAGQKGSSTMPHKRNPVKSEQLCGLSRLLRGYAISGLENIALWHERDISHSSVERITLSDATTLLDYMLTQLKFIIDGLNVYPENMIRSMKMSNGLVYSQRVMLELVRRGLKRETAYDLVQSLAMQSWEQGTQYIDLLLRDPNVMAVIVEDALRALFNPKLSFTHIDEIYERNGLK